MADVAVICGYASSTGREDEASIGACPPHPQPRQPIDGRRLHRQWEAPVPKVQGSIERMREIHVEGCEEIRADEGGSVGRSGRT
jgi:hypothetical protein